MYQKLLSYLLYIYFAGEEFGLSLFKNYVVMRRVDTHPALLFSLSSCLRTIRLDEKEPPFFSLAPCSLPPFRLVQDETVFSEVRSKEADTDGKGECIMYVDETLVLQNGAKECVEAGMSCSRQCSSEYFMLVSETNLREIFVFLLMEKTVRC